MSEAAASKQSIMDKFQAIMERTIVPIGMKISQQKYLAAIRDGMTVMIPITIIGGFAACSPFPLHPSGSPAATFLPISCWLGRPGRRQMHRCSWFLIT